MGIQFVFDIYIKLKGSLTIENMKLLFVFLALFSVSNGFQISHLEDSQRNLCCSTFTPRDRCREWCQGRSCNERCEQRCGVFSSFCGGWQCSDFQGCISSAPAPAPAPAPSSCVANGRDCYDNSTNLFSTCCSATAEDSHCMTAPVSGGIIGICL